MDPAGVSTGSTFEGSHPIRVATDPAEAFLDREKTSRASRASRVSSKHWGRTMTPVSLQAPTTVRRAKTGRPRSSAARRRTGSKRAGGVRCGEQVKNAQDQMLLDSPNSAGCDGSPKRLHKPTIRREF